MTTTASVTVIVDGVAVWREDSLTVGDINGPNWTRDQIQRELEKEAWAAAVEMGKAKPEDRQRAEFRIE